MSTTGVCPYCGKTFKRLSRHLSHCKARPLSEPPQAHRDLTGSKETLSTRRDLTGSKETLSTRRDLTGSKETLSTRRDPTGSKETLSTPPPSSRLTSSSSEKATKSKTPSKESPVKSPLTTTKKERREKASRPSSVPLSGALPPSTPLKSESESFSSASLMPSPLGSSPASMSRPVSSKKKTQRLADQTARSEQVSNGPLKQAQPKSQPIPTSDRLPTAFCPATDPITSATLSSTSRQEALLAPETKLEHASKSKGTSSQSLLTTQMSSLSEDRIPFGDVQGTGETPTMFLEDDEGVQNVTRAHARATLQNVKDTLRRSKGISQPGRLSLRDHIQTSMQASDRQPVETEVGGPLGASLDPTSQSNLLPDTSSHVRGLSPVEIIPTEKEGSTQARAIYSSPTTLTRQVTGLQSSLTSAAAVLGSTDGLIQRHRYEMALLPVSPPVTLPAVIMKDPEVDIANLKLKNAIEGNLAGRRLGQVRLGELPVWLAIKTPSRPREAVEAVRRGWQWYYRKYINVKRGGVGGVGMLLAGYCVLSYVWQYPHIKCDRWRKYH